MDAEETKKRLKDSIWDFIQLYKRTQSVVSNWQYPLLGFADCHGTYINSLRQIVSPTHYIPTDIMADCTVIISYFLPFEPTIGRSNISGETPSKVWVTAYNETNAMFPKINDCLTTVINHLGYNAISPQNIGRIDDTHIYSNWSLRHIAYAAGLGTFGINNMLITDKGTCGRLFSLITNLPVKPDQPLSEERCLFKAKGRCGLCVSRCPAHALHTKEVFDRVACAQHLKQYGIPMGASVCGKCVVGMPCTFQNPLKSKGREKITK